MSERQSSAWPTGLLQQRGGLTHPLPSHGNLEPSPYGAVVHLALPAPSSPTHFSLLPMTTLQVRTCLSSPQPRPWPVSRCCSRERFPKKQYSPCLWELWPALQQIPGAASKADGPLFLSVLFPPIPEKLVTKIRAGSFVDMQELLPDNMALLKQLENLQSDKAKSKAKLREVKTLSSRLYCFLAYIAVATPDKHTRDLLTYARLVMREALRTGGDGWAAYDRLFREHAALDKARRFDWTTLDSGLHQATFIRQAGPSGATCTHCAEADHSTKACALVSVQDSPGRRDDSPPPAKRARPSQQRPAVPPRPRGEAADKICISWNRGYCIFPRCNVDHICATCKKGDHRAKDCDSTPDDGYYKQWAKSGKGRQP